jgi:hypothetical protein
MHTWSAFEASAPAVAAAVRALLWIPGQGFGYLATVGRTGAPRIHPVDVALVDGRLVTFVVPSRKRDDLRRDGRFALHATQTETINDEAAITGRAVDRDDDAAFRAAAAAAMPFPVPDDHALFELGIETVLWAEYATPPSFPPRYHRWPPRA